MGPCFRRDDTEGHNRNYDRASFYGLGYVLQTLAENGALDRGLRVRSMTLPDVFIEQDAPAVMYANAPASTPRPSSPRCSRRSAKTFAPRP